MTPIVAELAGSMPDFAHPDALWWALALGARSRSLLLAAQGDLHAAVEAAERALGRALLIVGAIAMAGLLVVAWFLIRRGLLPLERAIAHRSASG